VPIRAFSHIFLTAAYSALGRSEDARAEAHEVLRIDPKFTVSAWMPTRVYKDPQASETLARFLVNAGLPE
jgi:adenylate cyclase